MYEPNVARVLGMIHPDDVVLDIGGWARPFSRANYVMDAEPYETRNYYGAPQGGTHEYFTADTWIQRDICDRAPYPFGTKEIDFVICSHTLEDVRDPLWVCSEMVRVAKRGYIEVPSRAAESCRGVVPGQVGWPHHRWLIDIDGQQVIFLKQIIHGVENIASELERFVAQTHPYPRWLVAADARGRRIAGSWRRVTEKLRRTFRW